MRAMRSVTVGPPRLVEAFLVRNASGEAMTGLGAGSFEITVYAQPTAHAAPHVDHSPVVVNEIDARVMPGWYEFTWTPTKRGVSMLCVRPTFDGADSSVYTARADVEPGARGSSDEWVVVNVGGRVMYVPTYVSPS